MKRRYIATAAIIFFLVVAAGVWFIQRSGPKEPVAPNVSGTPYQAPTAQAVDRTPASVDEHETTDGVPPINDSPVVEDEAPERIVILQFQWSDGHPAAGFEFTWQLATIRSYFEDGESDRDRTADPAPEFRFRGMTDVDGQFTVPPEKLSAKRAAFAIRLAHFDPRVRWRQSSDGVMHSQETLVRFEEGREAYEVVLSRLSSITFEIVYEDGVPYDQPDIGGAIHKESRSWFGFTANVGVTGSVEVQVPPDLARLSFSIHGRRKGFQSLVVIRRSASEIMPFERIVIPRDENQAVLQVDLSAWTSGEEVRIEIGSWLGMTGAPKRALGGDVWEDVSLRFSEEGMPYYLKVTGPSGVWRSDLFLMRSGATTVLQPVPGKPAAIRARIVDEQGEPVTPAAIHTTPWRYVNWFNDSRPHVTEDGGRSMNGEKVNAGPDGRCELGGLMPGPIKLIVEARGYEVLELDIELIPGGTALLGDIVMTPAKGKIIFRMINRKEGVKYLCWLWTPPPDSSHDLFYQEEPEDTFVIERVPLRAYQIGLAAGNGGQHKNFNVVELTETNPIFEVTVDVGDLKTRDERQAAREQD
jgi:hypothetical protein